MERRAIVVGAGVGGLAAAVALRRCGWDVTVIERSGPAADPGSGISLWPNALRALAALDLAHRVLGGANAIGRGGIRTVGGAWVARTDIGSAISRRYGLPLVLTRRESLLAALRDQLSPDRVRFGVRVLGVDSAAAGARGVLVRTADGDLPADLAVIADGARSSIRGDLFPGHPGVRYAGYTSWRLITTRPQSLEPAETWGRDGQRFAVLPLDATHVYCYATANAPPGQRTDERAELTRRFGTWHRPIPQLVGGVRAPDLIRTDIVEIAAPLPEFHRGRAVLIGDAAHPMTPDLGQGGCQALEDAVTLAAFVGCANDLDQALTAYSRTRAPRGADLIRRSHRAGRLYQAPPVVARTAARLAGLIPADATARLLSPVLDWQPP